MISLRNILTIACIVLKEAKRRKDFYVLFILSVLLILILSSVRFYELKTTVRYIKEFALLLIWIYSIFVSIAFAARQIPKEIEKKTIMPLLAKPISKLEFILGKFLGVFIAVFISLICFYSLFYIFTQTTNEPFFIITFFQCFGCHLLFSIILISMAMAGSVLMTYSANITLCFLAVPAILIFAQHLKILAITMPKIQQIIVLVLYYCIPHLEFYDLRTLIVHSWKPIQMIYIFIFAVYAIVWAAVFLGITYGKFKIETK